MGFVRLAATAAILIAVTLWLQCGGMAVLIQMARVSLAKEIHRLNPFRSGLLVIRFTALTIALHMLQILLWASFYRWKCISSWESAFYFSAGSYSTVGYTDVLLPQVWRVLGPIESVIGVVMCGMSVSVLFAIAARLVETEEKTAGGEGTQLQRQAVAAAGDLEAVPNR